MGVSRARATQWLDLLELPEEVIREALAKGDYWIRRVLREKKLRGEGKQRPGTLIR